MSADASISLKCLLPDYGRRDSRLWLEGRALAALFFLWLLSRWIFAGFCELLPDEAYYWTWSRHLSASYFDHPPAIAYLIRFGTLIFGDTELGVRWLAAVLTAGMVLILTVISRRLINHPRIPHFVPVVLLASPLIAMIGLIMTPDTPACFFQVAALACALLIFAPSDTARASLTRGRWWLLFGFSLGLALDSKYTSVLLGLAVLIALLSCAEGRSHLGTVWPWLGAAITVAAFSPVLFWNQRHQWASFRYQLHHGLAPGTSPLWMNLLSYIGGQFAVATPVFFLLCMIVLMIYWRRRGNPMHVRILLLAATAPLVFFAYSALHRRVEANWPLFAYLPAAVLVAQYLSEAPGRSRRAAWAGIAVIVALVSTIVIHLPEPIWFLTRGHLDMHQWDELFGWHQLARQVESARVDWRGQPSPVFTSNYQYAAELQFYLPAQPEVWPLHDPTRPTAYDFFPGRFAPGDFDHVVLIRSLSRDLKPPTPWLPLGTAVRYSVSSDPSEWQSGHELRHSQIETATR